MILEPCEIVERSTFDAIFNALEQESRGTVGPAVPRLLAVPINDDNGTVIGGLWGITLFRWFQLEMLFVPESLRGRGVGSALMMTAEREALARGCLGINLDTLSFQAPGFYEKLGFVRFGILENCPPGHQRLFFQKRLA